MAGFAQEGRMLALADTIYDSGTVEKPDGTTLELNSSVSREEGTFLRGLIGADPSIKKTLEVGCAYGLSSLHICEVTKNRDGAFHTILDPFQSTDWDSVGVTNLKRAGISKFALIEKRSEFYLPELAQTQSGQFDLIFIDGNHTFDHTLVDCFYATRLLRVGGYLVVDDADFSSIWPVIRHLETYPCYERWTELGSERVITGASKLKVLAASLIPHALRRHFSHRIQHALSPAKTMVCLKKRAEDSRAWDWHAPF
jgi:predicted O-methyltransferase YrrM